ncbi:unnamed protein product, partial [Allacma fusca]
EANAMPRSNETSFSSSETKNGEYGFHVDGELQKTAVKVEPGSIICLDGKLAIYSGAKESKGSRTPTRWLEGTFDVWTFDDPSLSTEQVFKQ